MKAGRLFCYFSTRVMTYRHNFRRNGRQPTRVLLLREQGEALCAGGNPQKEARNSPRRAPQPPNLIDGAGLRACRPLIPPGFPMPHGFRCLPLRVRRVEPSRPVPPKPLDAHQKKSGSLMPGRSHGTHPDSLRQYRGAGRRHLRSGGPRGAAIAAVGCGCRAILPMRHLKRRSV